MRHSEPNGEFGYAGVREDFLTTPLTVETLWRFRIMQQRLPSADILKEHPREKGQAEFDAKDNR